METHLLVQTDDIEIHHDDGETIIRGLPREKIRPFRDQCKAPFHSGSLHFHGVKKIDILRPGTNEPQQTILEEPGEKE